MNNGVAKSGNDMFQSREYFITEAFFSEFIPYLLDRVELWSIGQQRIEFDVFGYDQPFGSMPCGIVNDKQNVVLRILLGKLAASVTALSSRRSRA